MATKKNLSVEIRYTDEEQVRIDDLKAEIEKIDATISSTLAETEKYEKYIKNLGVDINNLSNANFKLFDDLAKANAKNVDCKIARFDKEQSKNDENADDAVAIELARKNEKDSENKFLAIQNEISNNEKEIAIAEKKLKIAKEELRKLQFAVKKSETQKIEQQQYLDEIKATALKRQTAKK